MNRKRELEGDPQSWRKTTNRYCAVWGCLSNSRRNADLSYFSLPQDPARAQLWLEKIQREMPSNSQSMRVCENHFEPQMVGNNKSRKRLMMDAVPTLYLPDSNCSRSYPMEFLAIEMAANKSEDSEDDVPISTLKQEQDYQDQDNNDSVSDSLDQPEDVKSDVSKTNGAADQSMDDDKNGEGEAGGGAARCEVGRMVDSSQADDRKMIRLVRERRLLYARNNMPVASYYSRVKALWNEVAQEMGWTVPDVRRKWSHIRNSYSRHLRNEMHGARTGKGRMVSRWYLADELEFLREHMATDMRPPPFSTYAPTLLDMEQAEQSPESVDIKPFIHSPWFLSSAAQAHDKREASNDDSCSSAFDPDENTSYFQFFRGIHNDYQDLPPKKQRLFKRKCLDFLHELLDEDDEPASMVCQNDAMNLTRVRPGSGDSRQICIVEKVDSYSDSGL